MIFTILINSACSRDSAEKNAGNISTGSYDTVIVVKGNSFRVLKPMNLIAYKAGDWETSPGPYDPEDDSLYYTISPNFNQVKNFRAKNIDRVLIDSAGVLRQIARNGATSGFYFYFTSVPDYQMVTVVYIDAPLGPQPDIDSIFILYKPVY